LHVTRVAEINQHYITCLEVNHTINHSSFTREPARGTAAWYWRNRQQRPLAGEDASSLTNIIVLTAMLKNTTYTRWMQNWVFTMPILLGKTITVMADHYIMCTSPALVPPPPRSGPIFARFQYWWRCLLSGASPKADKRASVGRQTLRRREQDAKHLSGVTEHESEGIGHRKTQSAWQPMPW